MTKLSALMVSLFLVSACGASVKSASYLAHVPVRSLMACQSHVVLPSNPGAPVKAVRLVFNDAMNWVSFARYSALKGYLSAPEKIFQDQYLSSLENFDVVKPDASSTLKLTRFDEEFGTLTPVDGQPSALRLTMDGVTEVLGCSR